MTFPTALCAAAELASDGAPVWVHLLPAAKIKGKDGRSFVLADPQAVIAASKPAATDLPIDYEHQIDDPAKRADGPIPAAGWIKELEARPDGIWGKVEWTEQARNMIEAREYRYLSPVLMYETETKAVRRIIGAALVHRPNLELTALSSEQSGTALASFAKALGLPADAGAADILTAINASQTPDPKLYVPVAAVTELLRERNSSLALMSEREALRKVEAAMDGGYITPAMKGWALALCARNPDSFDDFLSSAAPAYAHLFTPRIIGAHPGADEAAGEEAAAICAQLGLKPEALR